MPSLRMTIVLLLCLAAPLTAMADGTAPTDTPKEAAMSLSSSAAAPSDLSLTYLRNGLAVAVKKDARFPLASLRLYVHAGSAYETPDQAGISHQLEHMVFKGTESRPKGAIATDIEKAGGYLNAGTSFDYTVYLTDMPSDQWELGMDVLKDMAFHPSLDPQELESEKEVVLAELQRGEDSPSGRLFKRVQASALKGTPYERPIIGFPETIRNYTVAGMREYIDRLYQPQSMLLLVVGDVDPAAVLARAEKLFEDIPNTRPVTPPKTMTPDDFPMDGPSVSVEETPWNKVHMSITFPALNMKDAGTPALDIFSQLLGGDTSSYLYRTYKYDKRLVDSISVSSYSFERTGLFTITVSLQPEKLAAFWETFVKDLPTLAGRNFSAQELDRAKLAVTDTLYRQKETVAGTASSLGYFLFFDHGENAEDVYLRQIDLTDMAAVAKTAGEILRPERLSVTVLVPEKKAAAEQKEPQKSAATPDAAWITKTLAQAWPVDANARAATAAQSAELSCEVINLGKGRTLILQPDTSMPYAAVDLAFAGGDSLIPQDKQGLASLSAAVLTRGTKTMDSVALEAFKNDRAASLAASSGRETFKLSMDYPARFADDMWTLLHDTLTGATLPDEEVARARENQIAAIVSREDQPLGLAFRKIFPFLFGSHVYGYQSQGSKEAVGAFTRADVAGFWKSQATRPWVLSVCGTFDRNAVIAAAQKLPAPADKAPVITSPAWNQDKRMVISMPQRQQAHLLLVFPGVAAGSDDEPGLELLRNILAGQSGLLFRDLRDKQGLGYTVTAFQWQAPLTGTLMFYIGTEPDKLAQAHAGFSKVIGELHKDTLPEEELVRGKNQMRGDYVRARQRMSARSAEAASLALQGRPLDAEREVVEKAQTLTPADLQALARKYIVLDKAYTIEVLP